MTRDFKPMLLARATQGAHLCVGLDPKPSDVAKLHKHDPLAIKEWLMDVVDATAPFAATYKPNFQFYLRWGSEGVRLLEELNRWMSTRYKDIPRTLDTKWGDIGDTNLGDVAFAESLGVQAVTIHNYMGMEAMNPLLKGFFCFVLCKTSNEGSGEFQDLELHATAKWETVRVYDAVAGSVAASWNKVGPGAGLVVGATYPEQLAAIDQDVNGLIFLIPGVGKQGGSVQDVLASMRNNHALINVSSAITSAPDPGAAAKMYNDQIDEALTTI